MTAGHRSGASSESDEWLKIGEAAQRTGLTERALRLYEDLGILAPARTPGGTRRYRAGDLHRLDAIAACTRAGMKLGEIQSLATERSAHATGAEASAHVGELGHRLAADLDGLIDHLVGLRRELDEALDLVETCRVCPAEPTRQGCPTCVMNTATDTNGFCNLIWEP